MRVSTDIYLLQVSFSSLLNMFARPNQSLPISAPYSQEKSVEDIYCYEASCRKTQTPAHWKYKKHKKCQHKITTNKQHPGRSKWEQRERTLYGYSWWETLPVGRPVWYWGLIRMYFQPSLWRLLVWIIGIKWSRCVFVCACLPPEMCGNSWFVKCE